MDVKSPAFRINRFRDLWVQSNIRSREVNLLTSGFPGHFGCSVFKVQLQGTPASLQETCAPESPKPATAKAATLLATICSHLSLCHGGSCLSELIPCSSALIHSSAQLSETFSQLPNYSLTKLWKEVARTAPTYALSSPPLPSPPLSHTLLPSLSLPLPFPLIHMPLLFLYLFPYPQHCWLNSGS